MFIKIKKNKKEEGIKPIFRAKTAGLNQETLNMQVFFLQKDRHPERDESSDKQRPYLT